jgi:hypothetical protein
MKWSPSVGQPDNQLTMEIRIFWLRLLPWHLDVENQMRRAGEI